MNFKSSLWMSTAALLLSGHAYAADTIVVTAQKREQNLQDVPISISAETGEALRAQGVNNVLDLGNAIPFVNVSRNIGVPNIYIRGIGSSFLGVGGDGSIAFHVDGAYISRPRAQVSGMFDIERIEVLRGPQGTLYGRNATGGNVNVITRKPADELSAYGRVSVGNYGRVDAEIALGGPIAGDQLMGRVSFITMNHDGFGDNIRLDEEIDDQQEWGVRGQLLFEPTDRLSVLLIGDYYKADDNSYGWHITGPAAMGIPLTSVALGGAGVPENIRDIDSLVPNRRNLEIYGFNGTVDFDLSENFSVKSITAYRSAESRVDTDISAGVPPGPPTPTPMGALTQYEKADWLSEELQLQYSSDRVNALVGFYYFTEDLFGDVPIPLPILPVLGATGLGIIPVPFPDDALFRQLGEVETEAWAAFANVDVKVTDRLTLIAGLRYSDESRKSDGVFTAPTPFANTLIPSVDDKSWDAFSPKGTIDYLVTDDVHVYATVGRGFKSGVLIAGSANPSVDPETVTSYEAGVKGALMDGRAQFSLAGFYNNYKDLQLNRIEGPNVTLENATDARISGVEADLRVDLTDTFNVGVQGTWLNAKFREYVITDPTRVALGPLDLDGNTLPQAPEFSFHADMQKTFLLPNDQRFVLRADWSWKDDVYFDPFNQPNNFQEGYHYVGARASWVSANDRVAISIWGRNLTDKTALTSGAVTSDFLGFPQLVSVNEPLTAGADLELRY